MTIIEYSDDETKKQSFKEGDHNLGKRQRIIFSALEHLQEEQGDATDFEIARFLKRADPNYVRPRRYELVNKHKLVGFSQKRPCDVTGKVALAWKILVKNQKAYK